MGRIVQSTVSFPNWRRNVDLPGRWGYAGHYAETQAWWHERKKWLKKNFSMLGNQQNYRTSYTINDMPSFK